LATITRTLCGGSDDDSMADQESPKVKPSHGKKKSGGQATGKKQVKKVAAQKTARSGSGNAETGSGSGSGQASVLRVIDENVAPHDTSHPQIPTDKAEHKQSDKENDVPVSYPGELGCEPGC